MAGLFSLDLPAENCKLFTQSEMPIKDDVQTLLNLIARLPLFTDLDKNLLLEIAGEIEWFSVPGGTRLFSAGEAADAVFFVISGSLGAFAAEANESRRLLGRIVAGEPVGEMALISGKPRNATVIALRDSEMLRWSRQAFDSLLRSHPVELLNITRLIVQRLEGSQRLQGRSLRASLKTFAVIRHGPDVDALGFARQLTDCLEQVGKTALIANSTDIEQSSHGLHALEGSHDFVIYLADDDASVWARLCLRQSDAVLLLANAEAEPGPWSTLESSVNSLLDAQRAELVLLNRHGIMPGAAAHWLKYSPEIFHHHIGGMDDVRRLARLITGRGIGLTLSGGGARGFAHIGVLKALEEAGIPIDTVGGTSIGAIVAGGIAAGWDFREMVFHIRRSFVETNPLNDYTFPLISLVAGRKVSRLLQREFSDVQIEDLKLPYFCVSANLTSGLNEIHRSGVLWRWLRAAVAIPGILPPVFDQGRVFVDGATINNLPVDIMRQLGRGPVIGVDVGTQRVFTAGVDEGEGPPFWKFIRTLTGREKHINIFQLLFRAGMVNSATNTATVRDASDVLLQPPLAQMDLLNWQAFDEAVESGYRHTVEKMDLIKALL